MFKEHLIVTFLPFFIADRSDHPELGLIVFVCAIIQPDMQKYISSGIRMPFMLGKQFFVQSVNIR
jgi:hypothetical protein